MRVTVIPVVFGAPGMALKGLEERRELEISRRIISIRLLIKTD